MPTNKRITDLTDYLSVLPYSSEMFGVYQPLIGWKSRRLKNKISSGLLSDHISKFKHLLGLYRGVADTHFNQDHFLDAARTDIGRAKISHVRPHNDSLLLSRLSSKIQAAGKIPRGDQWKEFVNPELIAKVLSDEVLPAYREQYAKNWKATQYEAANRNLQTGLLKESAVAGALLGYIQFGILDRLEPLFFLSESGNPQQLKSAYDLMSEDFNDPFLSFDPKKDIDNVSLSPVGIVHLYRQFFFELDTFLGTPVSHVWLSPGSSVELIETSSRKSIVEKTISTVLESDTKTEKSTTSQDEISDAVKQDNKDDMKLGFTTTVNQSWGTGNASATGSLNMDKTQEVAREQSQKRMRQQTEKLSTEIRQNFTSTFKTITENTDTTSKRYLLNNTTANLINYELRRKMRQVGVQVQDIGSYLCWETFVDEPGEQLGLPDLIHIAKPPDLILVPNPKLIPMPSEYITVGFTGQMVWFDPDNDSLKSTDHPEVGGRFVPLNVIPISGVPNDYEVIIPLDENNNPNPFIGLTQTVTAVEDDDSWGARGWGALGMLTGDKKNIVVGIDTGPGGIAWDEGRITFAVSGAFTCKLSDVKKNEIQSANDALVTAKQVADNENQRKQEEAFRTAAKERITLASKIKKRKFEDLREEERTIVYRNLIRSLMTDSNYKNLPDNPSGFETRHVLSELINSIFDVDKMLYFVAPEWWKPRQHHKLIIGATTIANSLDGSQVTWTDQQKRIDNYFITEDSDPAAMGSSLGWLLQLDGDDLRNAFLNAPWVKAVIPIRPGKELAAINWLQNVNIEGTDGLDAAYSAPKTELDEIRAKLLAKNPADPVVGHADVTVGDAIRKLCLDVADKEELSKVVGKYPKEEMNDDNKVLATPVEKVYEHGFYPLKGGFKAKVEDKFEIISQWIEVLPTDQVVPVEVKYDPKTGRQI
ncbi:MAG: hypothetical protein JSS38_16325 [Nitrospira sp.]|nr:hypothetical protein [Nitrospira sp.]